MSYFNTFTKLRAVIDLTCLAGDTSHDDDDDDDEKEEEEEE